MGWTESCTLECVGAQGRRQGLDDRCMVSDAQECTGTRVRL